MKLLRAFYPYVKPYWKRLSVSLLGMSVFILLVLIPPLLTRYLINEVLVPGRWDRLAGTVALIIIIPVVAHIIRFFNIMNIMLASTRVIADLRVALYDKVLRLSMRYHGENQSGKLSGKIMGDVNMVQRLLTGETVRMVLDVIIVFFSLWVMLTISVPLTLMVCILVALYVLAYRAFSRKIRTATRSYRQIFDEIGGRLQETVAGVRQVRIFNREEWENTVFLGRTANSLNKELENTMGQANLNVACQSISGLGSAVIGGVGVFMVLDPVDPMSYGDLAAFSTYMWMMINPVVRLTNMAGQLVETFVSLERIAEVLDEPLEIQSKSDARHLPEVKGAVEFKDVSFAYADDKPLYQGLSLKIEPGMTVALVGETGCGKTTLTSLLMRYWDVKEGAVLLDGVDIRDVKLESLRQHFGVVLQDSAIFDGTFAENIAYGKPDAPREEIEAAARAAEIYTTAMRLPDGFDSVIGTNGVKLSVGEKQRVSIARAILKDPSIVVLDEATSSLDSQSEALIQKALEHILQGRTSFVVAHRLSTIVSADMIVVMDKGRIIEQGTHSELLALKGKYSQLYEQLRVGRFGGVS